MDKLKIYLQSIKVKNPEHPFFRHAFTHSSYINENNLKYQENLERLEFIGDATLSLIAATDLYNGYADYDQGMLTRLRAYLVCEDSLSQICKKLSLNDYLLLGFGENKSGGRYKKSIEADLVEAFAGAMYLVEGYSFTNDFFVPIFKQMLINLDFESIIDYKSRLQEMVCVDEKIKITYHVAETSGPANAPTFVIHLLLDGIKLGEGVGSSKKNAEQAAAKMALGKMVKNGSI